MDNIGLQPPILNSIPTTPAAVPTEEPKIVSPRGKFGQTMKKHGTKFLVGGLLTLLLGAGVWLEVNVVQQKQQVESQAAACTTGSGGSCPEPCNICVSSDCRTVNTTCDSSLDACKVDADCVTGGEDTLTCPAGTINNGTCDNCTCAGCSYQHDEETGKRFCFYPPGVPRATLCCTSNSPSPSPSASPTVASPSPSASPSRSPRPSASPASGTVACTSLESSASAPTLGQTVQYTCHGNFSIHGQGLPVAFFRYSTDNGANWTPAAAQTGANFNITNININKNGNWIVQCRICIDSSANTCTTWGQAN